MSQFARVTLTNAVMVNLEATPGATVIKRMRDLDGEEGEEEVGVVEVEEGVVERRDNSLSGGLESCANFVARFKEGEGKGDKDGCVDIKAQANCFRLWKAKGDGKSKAIFFLHPNLFVPHQMLYRALIRTHHMTSRKKISAISKAAKNYDCAVYLKTGPHPPGIMIAESENNGQEGLEGWLGTVKRLRYKDYQQLRSEQVETGRLDIAIGGLKEFESMKGLAADLIECGLLEWWEQGMGFSRGEHNNK
ncbi:MAG: hypothetical protein Q9217_003896 [Psora testacea]